MIDSSGISHGCRTRSYRTRRNQDRASHNLGWLIFAALLADFLLGIFAALGLEQAHVPPDFGSRHYLTFTFPYSHSLVGLLVWSVLFALFIALAHRGERRRVFVILGLLVLSHYVLDALVHVPELPLAGNNSPKIGLSLWNHLPLELTLETIMAAAGTAVYLALAASAPLWSRVAVLMLTLLFTAATWGQLFLRQPPTTAQLVPGWIAMPLLFSLAVYFLDRRRLSSVGTTTRTISRDEQIA